MTDEADEPSPRYCHFPAAIERTLCVYGGYMGFRFWTPVPFRTVLMFSSDHEKWKEVTTNGNYPPPDLHHGACTSNDHLVFVHGGWNEVQYYNNLYQLNYRDLKWAQLSSADDQNAPIAKRGHGIVYHTKTDSLIVFGGRGPPPKCPTQPGAQYKHVIIRNEILTNELHIFHLQDSKC